jgi:SWI/SNF-related matrix-associated actin-dependent regulator of chromatin subfamily A3
MLTITSIVFSCWRKTLEMVAEMLRLQNIPFEMINGSLSLNERLRVLKNFRSSTGANILLMTLGTGAVG